MKSVLTVSCLSALLSISAEATAQGLESRDRGTADPLLRDMVVAQNTTGTFQVDLSPGSYQVGVIMGDPSFSQSDMNLAVQGQMVATGVNTVAGQFYQTTVPVALTTGPLTVAFSRFTGYWVVNAVTVSRNGSPVHRFDFGAEGSPVAPGYVPILPNTAYDPAVGYGWQVSTAEKLRVLKTPDAAAPGFPTQADYMVALERFPLYAERGWHPSTAAGQPGWFGDPSEGEMGMRAMGNFIFVYSLLATDAAYDPAVTGIPQAHLLGRARECLEHMCRTHVTGDLNRPTGKKWGNHWQSAWWTVRMLAGAKLLWPQLTPAERAAVERVVVYEADRHLTRTVPSGSTSDTKSEENAWDNEVLGWATAMFPGHANAARWQQKANEFTMNTLSVPQDEQNSTLVDGRPVKDWVYTANVHNDYTIENHGAYHFCYMACPLHSFAWAYYGYVSNGKTPPQALFHHARDVFGIIRKTWLPDGRFAYLAGKDWPRYAYGLYFIVPALTMFENLDDDSQARLFERERFRLFEWESRQSGDGSFFSKRFTANTMTGRLLEYETDCAANLGLSYLLHKLKAAPQAEDAGAFERRTAQTFTSGEIKAALTRDEKWFCSWSWRSLSGKNSVGLVVPQGAGDLAEWGTDQFLSQFTIKGVASSSLGRTLVWNDQRSLGQIGGFSAIGQLDHAPSGQGVQVERRVAFVALTPLHKAVMIEELRARAPLTLAALSGTRFYLPNDLFNGNTRTLFLPGRQLTVRGAGGASASQDISSNWVNIDNRLGITRVGAEGQGGGSILSLIDNSTRQAPFNSLAYEYLDWDRLAGERSYTAGQLIRRTVSVIGCEDARMTSDIASLGELAVLPSPGSPDLVVVLVPGTEGKSYAVAANFGTAGSTYRYSPRPGSMLTASEISFTVAGRSVHVAETPSRVLRTTGSTSWELME